MQARLALQTAMLAQRGSLVLWLPVMLACGVGLYFALPVEPPPWQLLLAALAGVSLLALARRLTEVAAPLAIGLALVAFGLALAGARAHWVAAPVLEFRYYGPIQGRIVGIDRAASDVPRITLDQVVLADVAASRTPALVRLSLQGDQPWLQPIPGTVVILTGHLTPPNGPSEPGAFDFRRLAWFERLGAVGYSTNPVLTLMPAPHGPALWLSRLRTTLSGQIQARIAGDPGGYAAAVMTGDRSGVSSAATQAMRDSNLYHLVSISGMHMGMLVAVIFALVRGGVALMPWAALRVSSKKAAALVALPVAAFYLALAGRDVATERAFVMVAVMLVAILLDRQALTLRSVAIAAMIVLILRPESLINAGFQMSFAAVVALVATFQMVAKLPRFSHWAAKMALQAGLVVVSSLVAGMATAPFAAAQFNRIAHYGLMANLLAVPAMGFLVMPGAVALAILAPLGLDGPVVWVVDLGARWILWVAGWVAGMQGAVSAVISPPAAVLPLITLGGLIVVLWQGRARWVGLALPLVALALWLTTARPALLVADSGALAGVMTPLGRALTKPSGDGYTATNWLLNDGEMVDQQTAAGRAALADGLRRWRFDLGGFAVLQVSGETALAALQGCDGADILIANVVAGARPCLVLDLQRLRQTGAVAGVLGPRGLELVTAAQLSGQRLWSPDPPGPLRLPSAPPAQVAQARIAVP